MGTTLTYEVRANVAVPVSASAFPDSGLSFPIDWSAACDLVDLGSSRATKKSYRDYLGLPVGHLLTARDFRRLILMKAFCSAGRGQCFSKINYLS
jgi:hypothetical protein